MLLLKSQKNWIFEQIILSDLSPKMFSFTTEADNSFHLRMRGTEYFFSISAGPDGEEFVRYFPSNTSQIGWARTDRWDPIRTYILRWLESLKQELDQPDKWAQAESLGEQLGIGPNTESNSPFTYAEVQRIDAAIDEIRRKLPEAGLDATQLEIVNKKLDYLMEKAKTMGRVDWKNILVGTLVTLGVEGGLNPTLVKAIWMTVKAALQSQGLLPF